MSSWFGRGALAVTAAALLAGCAGGNSPASSMRRASTTTLLVTSTTSRPAPTTSTSTSTTVPTTTSAVSTTVATTTTTAHSTTTTAAGQCPGNLANRLAATGGAGQLITVVAAGYGTTYATLTAWTRNGTCYLPVLGPFSARVGRSGVTPAAFKREGDGHTPEGIYGFGPVMYGNAPNPGVRYPYVSLVCGDWWDEDPVSPQYNLFEKERCGVTPPFASGADGAGSEALWTIAAYPSFAVIDYNAARVPWVGSAIFLAATTGNPTAGCVAIPTAELDQVLSWMVPAENPRVVIGTSSDITSY